MDRVVGNFENKFKHLVKAESKGMALKLVGFYAVGWTLRKLVKWSVRLKSQGFIEILYFLVVSRFCSVPIFKI